MQSQSTAAILTTFNEVNMTPVMELRARYKDKFEKEHGVKLGFMSFFVKAAVDALRAFPQVNAEVRGDDMVFRNYCDVGIAVSSRHGLVVPIVAINKQTGALEGVPEMVTRGFVMDDSQTLLADGARLLTEVVDQASVEERTDQGLITEKVRVELRRFIRKRSGRRPFVLPVIMEI